MAAISRAAFWTRRIAAAAILATGMLFAWGFLALSAMGATMTQSETMQLQTLALLLVPAGIAFLGAFVRSMRIASYSALVGIMILVSGMAMALVQPGSEASARGAFGTIAVFGGGFAVVAWLAWPTREV